MSNSSGMHLKLTVFKSNQYVKSINQYPPNHRYYRTQRSCKGSEGEEGESGEGESGQGESGQGEEGESGQGQSSSSG
jgi:hypothetical protein